MNGVAPPNHRLVKNNQILVCIGVFCHVNLLLFVVGSSHPAFHREKREYFQEDTEIALRLAFFCLLGILKFAKIMIPVQLGSMPSPINIKTTNQIGELFACFVQIYDSTWLEQIPENLPSVGKRVLFPMFFFMVKVWQISVCSSSGTALQATNGPWHFENDYYGICSMEAG